MSAFQSLGATNPRWTPVIYSVDGLLAVLLAVGVFLGLLALSALAIVTLIRVVGVILA